MSASRSLGLFAVALALLFGAGAATGKLLDPKAPGKTGAGHESSTMDAHGGHEMAADPVRGLAVAENGLRLALASSTSTAGSTSQLRFRILDDAGRAVRDFEVEHTKRMHFIVVRDDLTGFQHLHPQMAEDGTWSTPLRLTAAGSYQVYADFVRDGVASTLTSEIGVSGDAERSALPRPATEARSDRGDTVRLGQGRARPGEDTDLRFAIRRNGQPVSIQPYLGAGGHLVALREGDLAFLHVHPTSTRQGEIGFGTAFPTAGRYRLFLQFRSDGQLHTVAFTKEVSGS